MTQYLLVNQYIIYWFKNKPVNYKPNTPRSQDATPVVYETTGLYGKKMLLKK